MAQDREKILKRMYEILGYVKNEQLISLLKSNESLFSENELKNILTFLESGDITGIYKVIKEKIKEYSNLIKELDNIKINKEKNIKLVEERNEQKEEELEIENLLQF